MSKLLKISLLSCITILILIIISILILTSSPGENLVKNWLEDKLSSELSLHVSMQSFETNLWSEVTIETLTIQNSTNTQQEPLVSLGKMEVSYSLWQIIMSNYAVDNIFIDSLSLSISTDSLNQLGIPLIDNPPATTEESTSEAPIQFSIDNITISRMAFSYQDLNIPLSLDATGAKLSVQGTSDNNYQAELQISKIGTFLDSIVFSINDFNIDASFKDKILTVKQMQAECLGLQLDASGTLLHNQNDSLVCTATLQGQLDSLTAKIAQGYNIPVSSGGSLYTQTDIDGTLSSPKITFHSKISSIQLRESKLDSLRLQAQYADHKITIDTLSMNAFDGAIYGYASTSLIDSGSTSVELQIENINIAKIWQAIYADISPYRGNLQGTIQASGFGTNITQWKSTAKLYTENAFYENKSIPALSCLATIDSGKTTLAINHGVDSIFADLQFQNDSLQGTFIFSIPKIINIARILDIPDIQGSIISKGSINGTIPNPSIKANIVGSKILYQNFPIENFNTSFTYSDSVLDIIQFSLNGYLDSIDSNNPPFGIDSVSGSLHYSGELSGRVNYLKGSVSAQVQNPSYGNYKIDSLNFESTIDNSEIKVRTLEIFQKQISAQMLANYNLKDSTGSFNLNFIPLSTKESKNENPLRTNYGNIAGQFSLDSSFHIQTDVNGKNLWLGVIALLEIDSTISDGDLNFNLSFSNQSLAPHAELLAQLKSIILTKYIIDSLHTKITFDDQTLTLDSLVSYALGQNFQATAQMKLAKDSTGSLQLHEEGDLQATLDVENFDLSVLQSMLFPEGNLAGTLSTSLTLQGTMVKPHIKGWLHTSDGRIIFSDSIAPIEELNMSLAFEDSIIIIDSARSIISKLPVTATGSVMTSQFKSATVALNVGIGKLGKLKMDGSLTESDINLDVSADSLNIKVFQPFLPMVDTLSGRLSSHMKVTGSLTIPNIDGSLDVRALNVQSSKNSINLTNGFASVKFDKNRTTIDSTSANINGGSLNLSGSIAHNGSELSDIEFLLSAQNLKFVDSTSYSILLDSTKLRYGKQNDAYILSGDIVLGETKFTKGLRPASVLPWVQTIETVDVEFPELIARTKLDIRIKANEQLWVDNNLAYIRLRTQLGVIGTPIRPNYTGLIAIEEGYLIYLDRRFKVKEGTVYFNDPVKFDPDIKLDASTDVTVYRRTTGESYTISIQANGLLSQLQYGIYSDPPLDKQDIVALLTLGATRTELTGTNEDGDKTGLTQVLKDRATMLTSNRVSGYISRRAGSFFGFDEFNIQGNLFNFNENWGPQLVASKKLTGKIKITYSTTVGHLNDQSVRLGYSLTPRWSLQGETDNQGRAGFDIKYGITFK